MPCFGLNNFRGSCCVDQVLMAITRFLMLVSIVLVVIGKSCPFTAPANGLIAVMLRSYTL